MTSPTQSIRLQDQNVTDRFETFAEMRFLCVFVFF